MVPKLLPVIVTTRPEVEIRVGETEEIAGELYVKKVDVFWPPIVATIKGTTPCPAGIVQVIEVCEYVIMEQVLLPTVTTPLVSKLVPVKVSRVPP